MKNEITKQVERLVAYDFITGPLSSIHQKANRARKEVVAGIYGRLLNREEVPEHATVVAEIDKEIKQKARGMKGGIENFKKTYPRYGRILTGMIEEERQNREVYVAFGLKDGQDLPISSYLRVMRELGLSYETAHKLYFDIADMIETFETKKKEGLQSILVD